MVRYRAAWVLPIAAGPIRDGWVEIRGGRVSAAGAGRVSGVEEIDLGDMAILPGLVNAHTHLELSYLAGEVPATPQFVSWIRAVVTARASRSAASSPEILDALAGGIRQAVSSGTAVVGDISNTLVTYEPLSRSRLAGVVFYELLRFNAPDARAVVDAALDRIGGLPPAGTVRASLAAHAPYSVSPGVLKALNGRVRPLSVHLAESAEEVEFLATGRGAWRTFLEEVGAWDPSWTPPRVSPVEYLDRVGLLSPDLLAVHGVQMTRSDLTRLAEKDVTLVTCPRSNARTGAGTPPIEAFYRSRVRVAVGTDSLASTPDLNLFSELAVMRQLAPSVPAGRLLDSATRQGATALGCAADYGTIEPGKRARLLAVAIPSGTADVEEYLVSGVQPDRVSWLPLGTANC
jgi:aminodeoxyfutalosine deaminase